MCYLYQLLTAKLALEDMFWLFVFYLAGLSVRQNV